MLKKIYPEVEEKSRHRKPGTGLSAGRESLHRIRSGILAGG
jgi:hypothetical protein